MLKRQHLMGLVLALAGILLLTNGGWIWGKALLAQYVLERSWVMMKAQTEGMEPRSTVKPWPWADTHAVARLQVPALNVQRLVLAGDSGRTLAFGPGLSSDSVAPGEDGITIISGHRDTHFRFLKDVAPGMQLRLESLDKNWNYRIVGHQIIDTDAGPIRLPVDRLGLLLVTCYPFDSLDSGGSLRLLVWAEPEWTSSVARAEVARRVLAAMLYANYFNKIS